MHACAAHDCGRSWHVHRHPISASCRSRQSDKSCTDNKKVNRAFRSCARRKFTGALKHFQDLVSRVIKNWAKANPEQLPNTSDKSNFYISDKKWFIPLLYSKYYNFAPGNKLPYLDVPLIANHGPYCGCID